MIKKDKKFIYKLRKKLLIQIIFGIFFVFLLGLSVINASYIKEINEALKNNSFQLGDKKTEWGIKTRVQGQQPEITKNNKILLDEVNALYIGNKTDKYIYLTFDMGYEAGYTEKILDVLKEENVKAAFFITGHYFNSASDIIKRMIEEGHIIGNHTVNHKCMTDLSDEENKQEINKLSQSIYEKFNYEVTYMRPPKGEFSKRTLELTQNLGYTTVMWSFAYTDFDDKNELENSKAIEKIINKLHNGEIMLLHGTSKTNMEILKELIQKIKQEGYEFKSLDEFKR